MLELAKKFPYKEYFSCKEYLVSNRSNNKMIMEEVILYPVVRTVLRCYKLKSLQNAYNLGKYSTKTQWVKLLHS